MASPPSSFPLSLDYLDVEAVWPLDDINWDDLCEGHGEVLGQLTTNDAMMSRARIAADISGGQIRMQNQFEGRVKCHNYRYSPQSGRVTVTDNN